MTKTNCGKACFVIEKDGTDACPFNFWNEQQCKCECPFNVARMCDGMCPYSSADIVLVEYMQRIVERQNRIVKTMLENGMDLMEE